MFIRSLLVAAAAVAALVPWPGALVEAVYGRRLYPVVNHVVGGLSSNVPVAVFDVVTLLAIAFIVRLAGRVLSPRKGGRVGALVGGAIRLVALACALYLWFWASWGLNYSRPDLEARLDYDRGRVSAERIDAFAATAVSRLNTLSLSRRAQPWPELDESPTAYRAAFDATVTQLGVRDALVPAPKPTIWAFYFKWAAIDGVTSPFTHEILVNPYVLGPERPMVVVHEWAHLAGFARESEASFVAALTCLRGDLNMQYSAWLALLPDALPTLTAERRRALVAALGEGPRADYDAIAARARAVVPIVRDVAWRSYDSYLKAHHVPEGVANYDEVVRLLLGTRASDDWELPSVPRLR